MSGTNVNASGDSLAPSATFQIFIAREDVFAVVIADPVSARTDT